MKTPRQQRGPRNELSDLRGVKQLVASPRPPPNTPVNDLTDVQVAEY